MRRGEEVPVARLGWLVAGFTIWFAALSALYGLHALGCHFGWSEAALRSALWATLGAHLVALAAFGAAVWRTGAPEARRGAAFLYRIAVWTLIGAAAASLLGLAPPLLLTVCA